MINALNITYHSYCCKRSDDSCSAEWSLIARNFAETGVKELDD